MKLRSQEWLICLTCLLLGCGGSTPGPPPIQIHFPREPREFEPKLIGLEKQQWDLLVHAESLELHYLDPVVARSKESFHYHKILGTVLVTDPNKAIELGRVVAKAMDREYGMSDCREYPTYGIRIRRDTEMLDLLIDFECADAFIYPADGTTVRCAKISKETAAILDRLLVGKPYIEAK